MTDRPTAETRWVCLAIAAILLAAVVLLLGGPGDTDELFAWPITPEMTPLFMGSAYAAGFYLFARAFVTERWHRLAAAFPPIALFAALMLVATLIHFDKFNQGDAAGIATASFYAWTVVYIASPFVVAGVWLRNRGRDDGSPEAVDAEVPATVRRLALAGGVVAAAFAAVLYAFPSVAIDIWPWELTPLTARVVASFTIEGAAIAIALARDPRWSAWRILTQTVIVGAVLLLIALARGWDDLDHSNPLTWLLVAGSAAAAAAAAALHRALERRARTSASVSSGA